MKDWFFIECTIIIAQKGGALKTGAHPTDMYRMGFDRRARAPIRAGTETRPYSML
jgi:hypothetical protein